MYYNSVHGGGRWESVGLNINIVWFVKEEYFYITIHCREARVQSPGLLLDSEHSEAQRPVPSEWRERRRSSCELLVRAWPSGTGGGNGSVPARRCHCDLPTTQYYQGRDDSALLNSEGSWSISKAHKETHHWTSMQKSKVAKRAKRSVYNRGSRIYWQLTHMAAMSVNYGAAFGAEWTIIPMVFHGNAQHHLHTFCLPFIIIASHT